MIAQGGELRETKTKLRKTETKLANLEKTVAQILDSCKNSEQ